MVLLAIPSMMKNNHFFSRHAQISPHSCYERKWTSGSLNLFVSALKLNSQKPSVSVDQTAHQSQQNFTIVEDPKVSVQWKSWFMGTGKNVMLSVMKDPPSLHDYLSNNMLLHSAHEKKLLAIWNKVKRKGSLRRLNVENQELFVEALRISYIALWGKFSSRSLEVSISTAAGIAGVLSEMGLDEVTILAGILQPIVHDIVLSDDPSLKSNIRKNLEQNYQHSSPILLAADSPLDLSLILAKKFGNASIELAKSYAKLPHFKAHIADFTAQQAENQIQLLTVLIENYRCLYIRIAEKIHTMRVLETLPLTILEQRQFAQEALFVYAPLAHRMNLIKFKLELEDLAFQWLNPDLYYNISVIRGMSTKAVDELTMKMKSILVNDTVIQGHNASIHITSRIKNCHQIYLKQLRKGYGDTFQVRDILGMRVIIVYPRVKKESGVEYRNRGDLLCYYVADQLSSIEHWDPIKKGRKDYIKNSKCNGYTSLHQYISYTAGRHLICPSPGDSGMVVGNRGKVNVEIQIRTKQMHIDAEIGEPAHWYYKDLLYRPEVARSRYYRLAWRSQAQLKATSHAQIFGLAKAQLTSSRVLILLEDRSTVINLKKGSTVLDAAFAILSVVAITTAVVKVNNNVVDFSTILCNGDIVEIQTTNDGQPTASPLWFSLVRSSLAINTLKQYFKTHD